MRRAVILFRVSVPVLSEQINEFVTTTIPNVFDTTKTWLNDIFARIDINVYDVGALKIEIFSKLEKIALSLTNSLPDFLVNMIKSLFSGK